MLCMVESGTKRRFSPTWTINKKPEKNPPQAAPMILYPRYGVQITLQAMDEVVQPGPFG